MRTVLAAAVVCAALIDAGAQSPTPATYKTEADLLKGLTASTANPAMLTAAIEDTDRHRINVVRRTKAAGATAHAGFAELHHIMEGSGTLVVGGQLVRPPEPGSPASIRGGESRHVSKGDVILVPSGMPHWYKDLDGAAITYLEVRWEEK
jgi:mannose-6-phosphate isomerase-like protein (cupin superfamily)